MSPKLINAEISKFKTFCFSRYPMGTQNSKELKTQSSWLCDLNWNHPHAETLNEPKFVLQSTTNRRQQDTPENTKLQGKKWPLVTALGNRGNANNRVRINYEEAAQSLNSAAIPLS
jgi:hypothetical protein